MGLSPTAAAVAFHGDAADLGRQRGEQNLETRRQALDAIADGALEDGGACRAITEFLVHDRIEGTIDGRDAGADRRRDERLPRRALAGAIAEHFGDDPGTRGTARTAERIEGVPRTHEGRVALGRMEELDPNARVAFSDELATESDLTVASARRGAAGAALDQVIEQHDIEEARGLAGDVQRGVLRGRAAVEAMERAVDLGPRAAVRQCDGTLGRDENVTAALVRPDIARDPLELLGDPEVAQAVGEFVLGFWPSADVAISTHDLDQALEDGDHGAAMMATLGHIPGPLENLGPGALRVIARRPDDGWEGPRPTRPNTSDEGLGRLHDEMYRPGEEFPGGTMRVSMRELADLTTWVEQGRELQPEHQIKARERLRGITRLLSDRDNPLPPGDRAAAERILQDLRLGIQIAWEAMRERAR